MFRREMSIAAIDGAVEEVAEEMACPERVIPPPIGVESTLEANGDGPYPASLERRRKEVEATLATNAAEVRRLAAATAVLGTKLVGGDVYARAGELTMLIMAGDRPLSELIDLLRLGYKRAQAARALQAAVRCRLRRLLGPNRERLPWGLAQAVRPGSVEMFVQVTCRVPRGSCACRGCATAPAGPRRCVRPRGDVGCHLGSGWSATQRRGAAEGFFGMCRRSGARSSQSGCREGLSWPSR